MTEIYTKRLLLIPCSLNMAISLVLHRDELHERSPIHLPENWPSPILKGMIPLYIEELEADREEKKLIIWLAIDFKEKTVVGDYCFRGNPKKIGTTEIGFNILPQYRRKGYGYEGAQALMDWMFYQHNVVCVEAECHVNNKGCIRILEKLGMCCIEQELPYLTWEVNTN
jgi:[ribosomal protein S5]-alanine N-acetyltransferase